MRKKFHGLQGASVKTNDRDVYRFIERNKFIKLNALMYDKIDVQFYAISK